MSFRFFLPPFVIPNALFRKTLLEAEISRSDVSDLADFGQYLGAQQLVDHRFVFHPHHFWDVCLSEWFHAGTTATMEDDYSMSHPFGFANTVVRLTWRFTWAKSEAGRGLGNLLRRRQSIYR